MSYDDGAVKIELGEIEVGNTLSVYRGRISPREHLVVTKVEMLEFDVHVWVIR